MKADSSVTHGAPRQRLVLVTPADASPAFGPLLEEALSGGDVAAVIIAGAAGAAPSIDAARALVPIAQTVGAAAIIGADSRLAGRVDADGIHFETGSAAAEMIEAPVRARRMIGIGGLDGRHDAMTAGEARPDYLFFGRLSGDSHPGPHPASVALAAWWAGLMEIPAVLMGGQALAELPVAAASGAEFVGLGRAVFEHQAGPKAAVEEALAILDSLDDRAGRIRAAEQPS